MQEEEYLQHVDTDDGWCTTCNEVTRFGGIEPGLVQGYMATAGFASIDEMKHWNMPHEGPSKGPQ